MFTPPNGQYLLRTTHCLLMALMPTLSNFQNHVYENEDKTHKIKQLLKKSWLVQLPSGGTGTTAVLPATRKHLTWTSEQICCNKTAFFRVLILTVYFWKPNTDCREAVNRRGYTWPGNWCGVTWLLPCAQVHPLRHTQLLAACCAQPPPPPPPSWLHVTSAF